MKTPAFDLKQAHRWFAVECNNRTWDLIEKADRTADETDAMLHAAHASCHHWLQIGGPLEHARACTLLATAYHRARLSEWGMHFAQQAIAALDEPGITPTPFDRACAHGAMAANCLLADRSQDAARHASAAGEAAAQCDEPEERDLVEHLYPIKHHA